MVSKSKIYGAALLFFLVSMPIPAFAHGEDKPGPHGGYIRMPGAFHTELVMTSKQELSIYLLDMEWANPTTENSSARVVFKARSKATSLTCKPKQDHFRCKAPQGISMGKSGKIEIAAKRNGLSGGLAVYELPLKFSH